MENYSIHHKLGKGAFGTVFKVKSKLNKHTYTAKLIDLASSYLSEALNEIFLLVQTRDHPCENVVAVDHFLTEQCATGPDLTRLWVLTEYCAGGTLNDYLLSNPGTEEIHRFMVQVSNAISHLHSLNIVHGNLKPDNVFVTRLQGRAIVKVADFGLAKLCQQTLSATDNNLAHYYLQPDCVAAYFLPPEIWSTIQVRAEGFTWYSAADIFALGLVLCVMLEPAHTVVSNGQQKFVPCALVQNQVEPVGRGLLTNSHIKNDLLASRPDDDPLMILILSMLARSPRERPSAVEVHGRLHELIKPKSWIHTRPTEYAVTIDVESHFAAPPPDPVYTADGSPPTATEPTHTVMCEVIRLNTTDDNLISRFGAGLLSPLDGVWSWTDPDYLTNLCCCNPSYYQCLQYILLAYYIILPIILLVMSLTLSAALIIVVYFIHWFLFLVVGSALLFIVTAHLLTLVIWVVTCGKVKVWIGRKPGDYCDILMHVLLPLLKGPVCDWYN